ncbi:hypothetical protein FDO65_01485 [Nakamurella flava]|uniref:Uncharacterized protein n=1 Tax=Nakamurella flava TaxID=2576308 RepID=A0A4V6CS72_9ACTN|nr:hypothetical protein [Nakamurella flava]TKV60415.1 hypothetical protein FDO65_01485 [Nakamurella flava]
MKRMYVFGAGVALGVAATRRTRRAKEAAAAAMKAKLTPSAIAADVADAIAEIGNAVGAFATDVRQGAVNRRASYRTVIDNQTGAVLLVGPESIGPVEGTIDGVSDAATLPPVQPQRRAPGAPPPTRPATGREDRPSRSRRTA